MLPVLVALLSLFSLPTWSATPGEVVLLGDSVAQTLGGDGLPVYARPGCGITDGVALNANDPIVAAQCGVQRDRYLAGVPRADTYLILSTWEVNDFRTTDGRVVRLGTPEWDAWMTEQYDDVVSRLAPAKVFFLTVPSRAEYLAMTPEEVAQVDQLNRWLVHYAEMRAGDVGVVDLAKLLCPSDCPAVQDGIRQRPDLGTHFDAAGAAWTRPRVLQLLSVAWERMGVVNVTPPGF